MLWKKFDINLKNKFENTLKFRDGNLNKFVLLRCKDSCFYKYMTEWNTFNEKFWPIIEYFYINLNLENFSRSDYSYTKKPGILLKLIVLGPPIKNVYKVILCFCPMFLL